MARKRKQRPTKPECLEGKWHFGPDVPTDDFFEHQNPEDHGDLGEVLENVIFCIEQGYFLRWEAIVCDELGLPLTARQEQGQRTLNRLKSRAFCKDDHEKLAIAEAIRSFFP
jgi:hypothetical protein